MLAVTLAAVGVLVVSVGPSAYARTDPGPVVAPAAATRDASASVAQQMAALDRLIVETSASAEPASRMGALRFEQQAWRDAAATEAISA